MDRIAGIETEYGCLVTNDEARGSRESWPVRAKNHLLRRARLGAIDLHYRDYEEPPGNGGFLINGGRLYLDMGHIEYASPECLSLRDIVSYDLAGDQLLQMALRDLGVEESVSFIKNNIDHQTGATFGCHENYLMRREVQFSPPVLGTLLAFLATRQIFTGAGRVGQANPLAFDYEPAENDQPVHFQLSQRADHIVNDIYQWVQFNRAIINARDEPLADYRKYRRLHLLLGDSNISPFATALKVGTTACVLSLLEKSILPRQAILADAVHSTRQISRDMTGEWLIEREEGSTIGAIDLQLQFLALAEKHLRKRDDETDWLLDAWSFTLAALGQRRESLIGGVDWITKKWLLETFISAEGLEWDNPWLESIDLAYHDINPRKGLFFGVTPAKTIGEWNDSVRQARAATSPPANTRAAGRARAIETLRDANRPYVINWDSIACDNREYLIMGNPYETYAREVDRFLARLGES
jgi:proteasome accessory factor A